MKKNITSLLIVCLYLFSCSNKEEAQPPPEMANAGSPTEQRFVSKSAAQEVASLFFADSQDGKRTKSDKVVGSVEPINDAIGTPLAYVINYKGGGWAIVSATQDYYPILAHSDESQFILDTTDMNSGLKAWINETSRAIESSEDLEPEIASQIALEWLKYTPEVAELRVPDIPAGNSPEAILCRNRLKYLNDTHYLDGWQFMVLPNCSSYPFYNSVCNKADQYSSLRGYTIVGIQTISTNESIGPLVKTKWHQFYPYNILCPNQYPAGCVAIAMAQIMKFHKYPTTFDWANIPDVGVTQATQRLISEVGRMVGTVYGEDGSSAKINDASWLFGNYGYKSADIVNHSETGVRNELLIRNRPVYMRGNKPEEAMGHAWVCDGSQYNANEYSYYVEYFVNSDYYDNFGDTLIDLPNHFKSTSSDYLHMNWGWGDSDDDGWYSSRLSSDVNYQENRMNIYIAPN